MTSIKILHIDDDEHNRLYLAKLLPEFQVEGAATGASGLKKLKASRFDATIIDLHMPVMDGFALMQEIEAMNLRFNGGKFFILSNDNAFVSKERAFSYGIEDYLSLSLDPAELSLRISARVNYGGADAWSGISLDPDGQGFLFNGQLHTVTRIEYRILCHLVRASGSTITRDELREKAWPGELVLDQTLNTHISNLRMKLRPLGFDVRALRNKGFKLVE